MHEVLIVSNAVRERGELEVIAFRTTRLSGYNSINGVFCTENNYAWQSNLVLAIYSHAGPDQQNRFPRKVL